MNTEDLIPKFEVGEKVIVHWQPFEWVCPCCGRNKCFEVEPYDLESTVIKTKANKVMCELCDGVFDIPDGWIQISNKLGKTVAPYTLLERVEVSR